MAFQHKGRGWICAQAIASALVASPAGAQLYRYVDDHGKVHYSDRKPIEATGRAGEKIGRSGAVTERIPRATTAEERAAIEAEKKRKEEASLVSHAEARRTQAILNAYASEQDLENARTTSLTPVREIIRDTETKVGQLDNRMAELEAERNAVKGKSIPIQLNRDLRQVTTDRQALGLLLEAKRKEERAIMMRFDEDKRRYVEGMKARQANRVVSN